MIQIKKFQKLKLIMLSLCLVENISILDLKEREREIKKKAKKQLRKFTSLVKYTHIYMVNVS